jgi:hypothetical protein
MASTYLSRTPASAGNRKTFTISTWIKLGKIQTSGAIFSARSGSPWGILDIGTGDGVGLAHSLQFTVTAGVSPGVYTSQIFRDTSAWYHIVCAVDTTQATDSNRVKIYINGIQSTLLSGNYPTLNQDTQFNSTIPHYVGAEPTSSNYFDGSMSHVHFIDGTAYDASAFGEYDSNGVWKAKPSPSVTYGTNGFFILKDSASVTDQSVNGNNFTVAGGTLTNTQDCPANVFATWNSLIPQNPSSTWTYLNGNTTTTTVNSGSITLSTLGMTSGKWYWEVKTGAEVPAGLMVGIAKEGITINSAFLGDDAYGYGYFVTGNKYNSGNQGAYGDTITNGDIVSVAYDADNGTLWFAKNGTWQNSATQTEIENGTTTNAAFSGLDTTATYFCSHGNGGSTYTNYANFGNGYFGTTAVASAGTNTSGIGIFEYDVPAGYTALCTKGLNL